MREVGFIGPDSAKNVFQAHGAGAEGSVVFRRNLTRAQFAQLLKFIAAQPPCGVAMEACARSHHRGRAIGDPGHEVRLIPPACVKPFVKRQKNDRADAEAIAEAVSRPTMRFVAAKSEAQQAAALACRTRDLLVRQRTQTINALRAIWPSKASWRPRDNLRTAPRTVQAEPRSWASATSEGCCSVELSLWCDGHARARPKASGWHGCWRTNRRCWSPWRRATAWRERPGGCRVRERITGIRRSRSRSPTLAGCRRK